jgi:Fe-S-cluster containining protein
MRRPFVQLFTEFFKTDLIPPTPHTIIYVMTVNLAKKRPRRIRQVSPQRQRSKQLYGELPLEHLIHVRFCSHQEQIIIALPYPTRHIRLVELVPMARTISRAIIKIVRRQCQATGRFIACDQCDQATCCGHPIGLSTIEAAYLAETLANDSSQATRDCVQASRQHAQHLDQLIARQRQEHPAVWGSSPMSELHFEQWYAELALDCQFLHSNKCSIYPERPLVCRHWLGAESQQLCNTSDGEGRYKVPMPVNLNDVLIETAFRCSGNREIVLLPAVVNWYEQHAQQFTPQYAADQSVWIFLKCLQEAVLKKADPETTIHFQQIR